MGITILKPEIGQARRLLAISDINGQLELLTGLLRRISFGDGDVLFVLGDFMENGSSPLETLRFLYGLHAEGRAYVLLGEKDLIYRELFRADRNRELLRYLLRPGNSLISDMLREQGLSPDNEYSMAEAKRQLVSAYAELLEFLDTLPAVIELPELVFAHARLLPGKLEELNTMDVIKGEAFFEKGYGFDKYVILGHWPSQCYDLKKIEANPLIQTEKRLITIDGGLGRRRDGQLNCLIIEGEERNRFSYTYADQLPKAKICHTQASGDRKNTIKSPYNEVRVLSTDGELAFCRQVKTGETFRIPKEMLSERNGVTVTEDITDYQLRLTEGDTVSVVLECGRGSIVKKDGVIGWYFGMLEYLPSDKE